MELAVKNIGEVRFEEESFEEVFSFVRESKIAYPLINILTPIPGTPLFDRMKAEGRLDFPDVATFTQKKPLYSIPNNRAYFYPKSISRVELEGQFMALARRLTSFREIMRRSFYKLDLNSFLILKMNLSLRNDRLRMEAYANR